VLIVVVVVVLLLLLRNHIGVLEVVPAALGGLLLEARIFGVDGILLVLEWRRRVLDYGKAMRWKLLLELLLFWNKRRRIRFKLLIIVTCVLNLLRAMTIGWIWLLLTNATSSVLEPPL